MFKLARDPKSAGLYAKRAKTLEGAIVRGLWNKEKGVFYGGRDWDDKPVEQETAHSMALAILLDMFPEHHQRWVDKKLVPMVKGKYTAKIVPSPYFMYYIFEALKKMGKHREVIDCIRRWWGSMLDRNLTTTEEVWNATAGKESLCHAWSAHPIIHLSNILLGVWQEAPGWKKVRFSPTFTHVRSLFGKVAVPQGIIEVHWEKKGKKTEVSLSLPNGINGTVDIPGIEVKKVQGKGRWVL
jgi:hypothetical protein